MNTIKRISTIAMLTVLAVPAVPTSAHADEAPPTEPVPCTAEAEEAAYWKAAYERADAEMIKWMQDYYILGNHVDAANRKIDRQYYKIQQQRIIIRRLKKQLDLDHTMVNSPLANQKG